MCKVLGKIFFTYSFTHLVTWISWGQPAAATGTVTQPFHREAPGLRWAGAQAVPVPVGAGGWCDAHPTPTRTRLLRPAADSFQPIRSFLWSSQTSGQNMEKKSRFKAYVVDWLSSCRVHLRFARSHAPLWVLIVTLNCSYALFLSFWTSDVLLV